MAQTIIVLLIILVMIKNMVISIIKKTKLYQSVKLIYRIIGINTT